MIKAHRVDDHKFGQIVFIWNIISMPSNDIKGRMVLACFKESTLKFGYDMKIAIPILKPNGWCQKISRSSKAIGTI